MRTNNITCKFCGKGFYSEELNEDYCSSFCRFIVSHYVYYTKDGYELTKPIEYIKQKYDDQRAYQQLRTIITKAKKNKYMNVKRIVQGYCKANPEVFSGESKTPAAHHIKEIMLLIFKNNNIPVWIAEAAVSQEPTEEVAPKGLKQDMEARPDPVLEPDTKPAKTEKKAPSKKKDAPQSKTSESKSDAE